MQGKTPQSKVENPQPQPTCGVKDGIEPKQNCWKVSALTTAPILLSIKYFNFLLPTLDLRLCADLDLPEPPECKKETKEVNGHSIYTSKGC